MRARALDARSARNEGPRGKGPQPWPCGQDNRLPASAHMCDDAHMDTTIRNLDPRAYRALKARASFEGKTIGDAVNEAIRAYVGWPGRREKSGSLRSLRPQEFPPGNERLSEEIDAVVYGN